MRRLSLEEAVEWLNINGAQLQEVPKNDPYRAEARYIATPFGQLIKFKDGYEVVRYAKRLISPQVIDNDYTDVVSRYIMDYYQNHDFDAKGDAFFKIADVLKDNVKLDAHIRKIAENLLVLG